MRDVGPDGMDDGAKKGEGKKWKSRDGGVEAGVPAVNLAVSATVDSTSSGTCQESIQRG